MLIYYAYIVYCSIVSFLSRAFRRKSRRNTAILLWLGLFLIMALRSESVGNDLMRYLEDYRYIEYIHVFRTRTESGYVIFEKVLNFLDFGPQAFVAVVSFIISTSIAWFFYKYSKKIGFSFLLYLTVGAFSFTMTGIRQSLAISIILIATHYAIQRRLLLFIVFTLLATSFHHSAFVFLPAYLIFGVSFKSYKPIIFFVLFLIVTVLLNQYLFSYLAAFSTNKYSEGYLDVTDKSKMNVLLIGFRMIFPLLILFFWMLQKRKIMQIPKLDLSFFTLTLVSTIFTVLSLNLSIVNRLSYYFFTGTLVLIPNALCGFKDRATSEIFQFIILVVCIAFFMIATNGGITRIDNYQFFWN